MPGTANPAVIAVGAIAGLLPDIDISTSPAGRVLPWISRFFETRMPHRSCTHSLVASGAIALLTFSVNNSGGILTQFNRLIASPSGVQHIFNESGSTHLIKANIKGVRTGDRSKINGQYLIIQLQGTGFLVQSDDERIFERVVDDVFYRVNPETGEREDVLYAKDVIKEIEKESKKSDSDSESENP
ncbi:metal-dependent hydrolase [Nostoc sp. CHAB 5715]|uniref:metal-dependent hydrolase n=1 Tax=Nostoc sp. CHAB 5715 TaxID=2780400 RepID=UPI001E5590FD|nr:metal-dependent hydrolase [Nostoc sp. CHAB 5715]MCC5625182.1 metal-dependent hydrolase [Nostoc sp. CHAB 5715]